MADPVAPTDSANPVIHFAETLESAADRGKPITVGTDEGWYGGKILAVDNGVAVLDNDQRGFRMHIRLDIIRAIREYLPAPNGQEPPHA